MKQYDIIVIGAGPAGLFTAIQIGSGKRVAILEKNGQCGRKLLLTGAGKCNITQAGDMEKFLDCYGKNARFVRHSLTQFTNTDLLKFFKKRGLDFTTMDNGKIFPKTMKASDVLNILTKECTKLNIPVHTHTTVVTIEKVASGFKLKTTAGIFQAEKVVIATGGVSYPQTGSTGDGHIWAKALGHKIIPTKPALTSLKIKNYQLADLSGQSFANATYTHWRDGKKIGTFSGQNLLLTHTGLSGPAVFIPSRYMSSGDLLKLNFLGTEVEATRQKLINDLTSGGRTLVKTVIRNLDITKSFADKILDLANIDADLKCAELKKEQRTTLITLLLEHEMEIKALGGYHVAQVTAGGVSTKEINPKTMASRKIPGLYFVGEVTDVDGDTGGYNIQIAMSMAYVCGAGLKGITEMPSKEQDKKIKEEQP